MQTEQEYYQKLAQLRSQDRIENRNGKNSSSANSGDNSNGDAGNSAPAVSDGATGQKRKKIATKDALKKGMALATAFSAFDMDKDGIHLVVIFFSIIADLFTLIPVVGSLLAIPFSILIWVLYLVGGHLKHRISRKVVTTVSAQVLELFGGLIFGFLSMLPFYTISALLNLWFALAERKSKQ